MTDEDGTEPPVALDAYETLAEAYDEQVGEKPFNAFLERPATVSLLPDIDGWSVLDAGCGPGVTTADLAGRGARVVGVDVSPRMLRYARDRVGSAAELARVDLGRPLPFSNDSFDLVHSSLAFDYVADWERLFTELVRVLGSEGTVVCSVQHPVAETMRLEPENYFSIERHVDEWTGFGERVDVPFYRRPLGKLFNPLFDAGFVLTRIVETQPTERFRERDPETYERVSREPTFLSLRARATE